MAGFLTDSLVSLSSIPHKDVNRARSGQGNAGAGFPGVLEQSPERHQECQLTMRDLPLPSLSPM